jgi:competence protein ComEC
MTAATLRTISAAGSSVLGAVRARHWHAVVAWLVAGLAVGWRWPVALLVMAPIAVASAGRGGLGLLLAAALLAGALIGAIRVAGLERTSLGPLMGHATRTRVTLEEAPRARAFGARAAVVRMHGERVLLRAGRRVRWPPEPVGSQLAVAGVLEPLTEHDAWRSRRGVHAELVGERIVATGRRRGGLAGAVDRVRTRAERALTRGVPARDAALVRGMVLGEDDALPARMRDDFRAAGLAHLVAASGQNVMLLAALALAASVLLGVGHQARWLAVLLLIALYVPLAGAGPSIQRAGVMGAAGVVAVLAGRPAARWHALLLAAAVTLTLNPRAAEEPGWQLSFAAVVGLLALAEPVAGALRRRGAPRALAEAVAVTTAATLATAPLIALHFGRTSLVSLPANVLAAPAVAPVMWLGMLAGAVGQLSPGLAGMPAALAALPAGYVAWVGHGAAALPGAQVALPPAVVACACGLGAAAVRSGPVRRLAPLLATLTVLAGVAAAAAPAGVSPPTGPRVTFLSVGQGDATLIQDAGRAVLVDAGPADGPVLARLRHAGVTRLDLLVVTHAQADHDGGAASVLRAMPVSLLLDGRDGAREPDGARMAAAAAARGVRRIAPAAGQVLRVGSIVLRVLSPRPEPLAAHAGADPNERAIVLEATVGPLRTLLTADAESDVLERLDLSTVDVLKVSHHGSADEGLAAMLPRLRPRLAVIEVGAHNLYGHPVASTMRALFAAGVRVLRTDRDGSVAVEPATAGLRVQAHA